MRDVVATVRRMRRCTIDALTSELTAKARDGGNGFVYYRRNERGRVDAQPCTESTMRKHVRFCQDLGFLTQETELRLSNSARDVRAKADYDAMLETQLIEYLDKNKITMTNIEDAIKKAVTSDPETIFNSLANKSLSEEKFRSCLNLLGIVGNTIIPYRKKMYFIRG
jgi:hypothetical protein